MIFAVISTLPFATVAVNWVRAKIHQRRRCYHEAPAITRWSVGSAERSWRF
jgi:hypothetical protein